MKHTSIDAIVKTVRVPLPQAEAFALFTARMSSWWPLDTHSVGKTDAIDVAFPAQLGGEIVERLRDGGSSVWGTVTRWDPPAGVAFTWHPGGSPDEATSVDVDFEPDGGGTVVRLTHDGWLSRGDGDAARLGYDTGWDLVLGRFVAAG